MKYLPYMTIVIGLTGLALAGLPASAAPPTDAMPASSIMTAVEKVPGFVYLREMQWDEQAGEWTAIYHVSNGMDKRVRIDARTGKISEDGDAFAPSGAESEERPTVEMEEMPVPNGRDGDEAAPPDAPEGDDTLIPTPNGMEE